MDRIDVGGLRIAYHRAGDGPAVVLLHGGLSDGREWRRQMTDLSDEFTVVAWDAPGCGGSDDPPEGFTLADYADAVLGLVAGLGLIRPSIGGLSFGGGLALEVFRRAGGGVRSLVLASAYAGWAGSLPAEEVAIRLAWAEQMATLPPGSFRPDGVPGLLTEPVPPELERELAELMADVRPASAAVMGRSFAEADLRDVLPTVDVPTLLLYGELDQRSPLPVAEALHKGIPHADLVILPGAGHQANMEAPEAFSTAVRDFLRAVG